MQEGRPISFESRSIKGKYFQKAIYEKEMLEILHALNKWRPYLMGRHFKVKTDHDSIKLFGTNITLRQVEKMGLKDVRL